VLSQLAGRGPLAFGGSTVLGQLALGGSTVLGQLAVIDGPAVVEGVAVIGERGRDRRPGPPSSSTVLRRQPP
jgi:hypothetical protein